MMFATIINFVLEREGGYVNDPDDPGGATNMGITQKTLDAWCDKNSIPRYDVKFLKLGDAINIYYQEYWNTEWEKLGFGLAACMMDTTVNMGGGRANLFLKNCSGSYVAFLQQRIAKYKELIERNPTLKKFERGWMNRITELRRFIDNELSNTGGQDKVL